MVAPLINPNTFSESYGRDNTYGHYTVLILILKNRSDNSGRDYEIHTSHGQRRTTAKYSWKRSKPRGGYSNRGADNRYGYYRIDTRTHVRLILWLFCFQTSSSQLLIRSIVSNATSQQKYKLPAHIWWEYYPQIRLVVHQCYHWRMVVL